MLKVFIVGEIIYNSDFYDYEIKYIEGKVDLYILVWVSEVIVIKIKEMVIQVFLVVDVVGLVRVDFFYVEKIGEILINEINIMFGFILFSMYFMFWEVSGIFFLELVDILIQLVLERYFK